MAELTRKKCKELIRMFADKASELKPNMESTQKQYYHLLRMEEIYKSELKTINKNIQKKRLKQ